MAVLSILFDVMVSLFEGGKFQVDLLVGVLDLLVSIVELVILDLKSGEFLLDCVIVL
jgi:hypothetical protein